MNSRFLSIFCSVFTLLTVLSACTGEGEVPSATAETLLPPTMEVEPTQTPVELASLLAEPAALPPVIIGYRPAAGEEASLSSTVEVSFDQDMNRASVEAAFQMTNPQGKTVAGKFAWKDASTLRFQPAARLDPGVRYEIAIGTGAAAQNGVLLQAPAGFYVNTVSRLEVTRVFPSDGANQVDVSGRITVMFNRPVVPLTIAEEQSGMVQPLQFDPPTSGKGEWVNTSVYVFSPDKPLNSGTRYTVTIPSGLADSSGSPDTALQKSFRWQFSTLAVRVKELQVGKDSILPERIYSPANVSLTPEIKVFFEQEMDKDSVIKATTLTGPNGEKIPLRYRWEAGGSRLIAAPLRFLQMGKRYEFSVGQEARAADGGFLAQALPVSFSTINPPGIRYLGPAGKRNQGAARTLLVEFASPVDLKSMDSRIVFTPPLKDRRWYYNEDNYSVTFYGLEPSTEYQVTALVGIRDIYGNAINQAASVRFTSEPLDKMLYLEMPYMPLYRVDSPQEFFIRYTNINTVDLSLYRVSEKDFLRFQQEELQLEKYTPAEEDQVWMHRERSQARLNEIVLKSITFSDVGGRPVSPGFYFLGMSSGDFKNKGKFIDGRLLVISPANLTFKQSNSNGLLWLTALNSGKPLPGVPLKVVDARQKKIAAGKTDQDGLFAFDLPEWQTESERVALYAIVTDEKYFAFTNSSGYSGVSPEDFGIWSSYYSLPESALAYLYTERPLYRPGQPVYFKGIVRMDRDMAYSLPTEEKVELVISSYEGEVYRVDLPLSEFGSFDGKFLLDENAALGSYTIEARFPKSDRILGTVYFTVAEYRKPEFIVDVSAQPADVLVGNKFEALISAEYYSGGALSGAQVSWTLNSFPTTFTSPASLSAYNFIDDTVFETGRPERSRAERVVAQGSSVTGEDGKLVLNLLADPQSADPTRSLVLDVTVTDFAGTSVGGQAQLTAHHSQVYAGIRPERYVGKAGEEQRFELVAVDWGGKLLPGQKMDVVISERQWFSIQEQDARGVLRWISSVKDIPLTRFSAVTTGEDGKATVSFTPEKGGIYRARVTAYDKNGKSSNAVAYLWVSGGGYIPWQQTNDRTFQLVADRDAYDPGDQAEILIASPFQGETYALVTVERGLIRQKEVIKLTGNSTLYRLPVTADMAPVVYVSVVVVKGVDESSPRPDFKVGMARLNVSTKQQELKVEVTSDRLKAAPGEEVTYTVKVSRRDGTPVVAEVSLGLSDLAALNLAEPNSAPILDYFYSRRSLQVSTSIPINLLIEEYNKELASQLAEGMQGGSGGGKGGGIPGVPEIRGLFPDTAFWRADVMTNKKGEATVSVRLPDNLTTWRMDARAVTEDTLVGQATVDLIGTRPLMVRPQTPRFFVAGDKAVLGAGVHNNTGVDLTVDVALEAGGLKLIDPPVRTLEIKNGEKAYITWRVETPPDADRADLVFSARGGEYQDASRPTLGTLDNQGIPIYRYEVPETVSASGDLKESTARTEIIYVPEEMKITHGEVKVEVAPSLAAGLRAGLSYLEHFPYECTEQTVSRFLPNVLSTQALKTAGLVDEDLEKNLKVQVNTALQRLYSQQNEDGGWGWWNGTKSQALTTAYVTLGLIEAQKAGYSLEEAVLNRGMRYLYLQASHFEGRSAKTQQDMNTQAFVLYVLARGGSPATSDAVLLYESWHSLSLYARAFLAQTLYEIDPADPRLTNLVSDLSSRASLSAAGAHWQEESRDVWNWNTDTRTTAIVLDALIRIDPQNPVNTNAVRWLMKNRFNGRWNSTQETAWSLMALTDWMVSSGELEASYNYAVGLNGVQVAEEQVSPESITQTKTLQFAVEDLLAGQANRLVFARSGGPGSLYYTADLTVNLPVEKIQSLDRGLIVSRKYYTLDDNKHPITQARQGDIILGRLTIVVPQDTHYLLVEDPLPAGLEAVDVSLKTSPQREEPASYDWSTFSSTGWGWWYFDHIELRDEKVVLSTNYLPAGTYVYTYLARASVAGSFQVIPPTAQEFYFPDVYGRGEGSLFEVK